MSRTENIRISSGALLALLAIFCLALGIASTGMGYIEVSAVEVLKIVIAKTCGVESLLAGIDRIFPHVVWEVRLPRIVTSMIVGAGLAMSGVVFQGILINPLADPFTLGVSSGAAFGASLTFILGLDFLGAYTVCLLAFIGAIGTLFLVVSLSMVNGRISPTNLILSGVIVAAILSAGISFIKYLADEQVAVIIFWLMGSFVSRTWTDALLTLTVTVAGFFMCAYYARDLNIMSLGDRSAESLGVETRRVRVVLLISASMVSAICVSVSGIIGFVGLLIPHLMRFIVGPDNRLLLPASALAGAALLLSADTTTRALLPHEVPIGVLTAIIGGPFFCYVFRRKQLGQSHA